MLKYMCEIGIDLLETLKVAWETQKHKITRHNYR